MRKASLVLLLVITAGTVRVTAQPLDAGRGDGNVRARIIHVVRKVFRIVTNTDGLIPPVPATPPPPRP